MRRSDASSSNLGKNKNPRRTPKSYHHGDLKTALKKAALKLIRQKGPRNFSLNEASRLARVTVGAPYRHFADKDALLAEIICDGNALLAEEVRTAIQKVSGIQQQMLEAGMAYLRFSINHAEYFALMFRSGIDKLKYPEVQRSAEEAFRTISDLAQQSESTTEIAHVRAISAWALVHGLATLNAEGALDTITDQKQNVEDLRPVLWDFITRKHKREAED
jgi:AcrR family transcriptional regulator